MPLYESKIDVVSPGRFIPVSAGNNSSTVIFREMANNLKMVLRT